MPISVALVLSFLGVSAPDARPAPIDPLDQLAAALAELDARSTVKVRLEHRATFRSGDDEKPSPTAVASVVATSGPDGLRLTWSATLLARVAREEKDHATNPETPTPTKDAVTDLPPLVAMHVLDAVPELLRGLRQATLVKDEVEPLDGVPTRVLLLDVNATLSKRERKYVNEVETKAKIWLGADGIPIAAERRVHVKGRAFLVISFESEQTETWRFLHNGDRLLVTRQESRQKSEGAGETGTREAVTTLTLLD